MCRWNCWIASWPTPPPPEGKGPGVAGAAGVAQAAEEEVAAGAQEAAQPHHERETVPYDVTLNRSDSSVKKDRPFFSDHPIDETTVNSQPGAEYE